MAQRVQPLQRQVAQQRLRGIARYQGPAKLRGGLANPFFAMQQRLRRSPWLLVFLCSALLVTLAWFDYQSGGLTLRYSDGRSKLNMARRIWDGLDPGFGQIGGIWLPLPTLLMALTAWWSPMYYSGLAGSIWSMLAFAGAGAFLFLIGRRVTGHWTGGAVSAIFLAFNPAALYLSTTPMAEPLLLCGISAAVYMLMRLEEKPHDPGRLVQFSPFVLAVTLIRYEGWFLLGVSTLLLCFFYLRAGQGLAEMQARLISFLVMAAQGVVLWLLWETVIFKNPLFFSTSQYSAHAIDVVQYGITKNVHNLPQDLRTYWGAMSRTMPAWLIVLAAAGLVAYVLRECRSWRTARVSPLALGAIPIFFIFSLYVGQAAIDIATDGTAHYNVRYGVIALPLVAVFASYALVALLPRTLKWIPVLGAVVYAVAMVPSILAHDTQILNDRGAQVSAERVRTSQWLQQNYDGGRLLMEVFKNNDITFASHISQGSWITEGNTDLYQAALRQPQQFVDWIYTGLDGDDTVTETLLGTPTLDKYYDLVYASTTGYIYEIKPEFAGQVIGEKALAETAAAKVIRAQPVLPISNAWAYIKEGVYTPQVVTPANGTPASAVAPIPATTPSPR